MKFFYDLLGRIPYVRRALDRGNDLASQNATYKTAAEFWRTQCDAMRGAYDVTLAKLEQSRKDVQFLFDQTKAADQRERELIAKNAAMADELLRWRKMATEQV